MSSLPQSKSYRHLDDYQRKALATRKRRQAKGMYKRPSKAQKTAYIMLVQMGRKSLGKAELELLATHPWLTPGQRSEFAAMAEFWGA